MNRQKNGNQDVAVLSSHPVAVAPKPLAVCCNNSGNLCSAAGSALRNLTWDGNGPAAPNPSDGSGNWDDSGNWLAVGGNHVEQR